MPSNSVIPAKMAGADGGVVVQDLPASASSSVSCTTPDTKAHSLADAASISPAAAAVDMPHGSLAPAERKAGVVGVQSRGVAFPFLRRFGSLRKLLVLFGLVVLLFSSLLYRIHGIIVADDDEDEGDDGTLMAAAFGRRRAKPNADVGGRWPSTSPLPRGPFSLESSQLPIIEIPFAAHNALLSAKSSDSELSMGFTTPLVHASTAFTDPIGSGSFYPMRQVMRGVYRFPEPLSKEAFYQHLSVMSTRRVNATTTRGGAAGGGAAPLPSTSPEDSFVWRLPKQGGGDSGNTTSDSLLRIVPSVERKGAATFPWGASSSSSSSSSMTADMEEAAMAAALAKIPLRNIEALRAAFNRYRALSTADVERGMLRRRRGRGGDSNAAGSGNVTNEMMADDDTESSETHQPPIIIPAYGTACIGAADCDDVPLHFTAFESPRIAVGYFILVINSNDDAYLHMAKALHRLFPLQFLYLTRRWYRRPDTYTSPHDDDDGDAAKRGAGESSLGRRSTLNEYSLRNVEIERSVSGIPLQRSDEPPPPPPTAPSPLVLELPNGRTISLPSSLNMFDYPVIQEAIRGNSYYTPGPSRRGRERGQTTAGGSVGSSSSSSSSSAALPPSYERYREAARPSHAFPVMGFSQTFNLILNLVFDGNIHGGGGVSGDGSSASASPMLPPAFIMLANADYIMTPMGMERYGEAIYDELALAAMEDGIDEQPLTRFWAYQRDGGNGNNGAAPPPRPFSTTEEYALGADDAVDAADKPSSSSSSSGIFYLGATDSHTSQWVPYASPQLPEDHYTNPEGEEGYAVRRQRWNRRHASMGIRGSSAGLSASVAHNDPALRLGLRSGAQQTSYPQLVFRWESFSLVVYTYWAWKTIGLFHEERFPAYGEDIDLMFTAVAQGFHFPEIYNRSNILEFFPEEKSKYYVPKVEPGAPSPLLGKSNNRVVLTRMSTQKKLLEAASSPISDGTVRTSNGQDMVRAQEALVPSRVIMRSTMKKPSLFDGDTVEKRSDGKVPILAKERKALEGKLFHHYSSKSLKNTEVRAMMDRYRRREMHNNRWHMYTKGDNPMRHWSPWALKQMSAGEIYRNMFGHDSTASTAATNYSALLASSSAASASFDNNFDDDAFAAAHYEDESILCSIYRAIRAHAEGKESAATHWGMGMVAGGRAAFRARRTMMTTVNSKAESSHVSSSSNTVSIPLSCDVTVARANVKALASALSHMPLSRSGHYVDMRERRCLLVQSVDGPWDPSISLRRLEASGRRCYFDAHLAYRHIRSFSDSYDAGVRNSAAVTAFAAVGPRAWGRTDIFAKPHAYSPLNVSMALPDEEGRLLSDETRAVVARRRQIGKVSPVPLKP